MGNNDRSPLQGSNVEKYNLHFGVAVEQRKIEKIDMGTGNSERIIEVDDKILGASSVYNDTTEMDKVQFMEFKNKVLVGSESQKFIRQHYVSELQSRKQFADTKKRGVTSIEFFKPETLERHKFTMPKIDNIIHHTEADVETKKGSRNLSKGSFNNTKQI